MASENLSFWAGHGQGHTEICFDAGGNTVYTSGADGNIKIWSEFDGGKKSNLIKGGETVYALAVKGDAIYAASDNNTVDKFNQSDGTKDGILLRFTGNVTHLALSESQNTIVAGSSDFTAKSIELETNDERVYSGHKAPILSVAIDPLDEFLATVSCDGDFRIWSTSDRALIETIRVLKPSNDVCNSESLCRMSWRPATGEDIAVPSGNEIKVFSRGTWSLMHSFKTALTNKPFNCCGFSHCGRFLAAATIDGWICIWDAETQDCLQTVQHPHRMSICSIAWDPRENNTLAVADVQGQVGLLKDVVPSKVKTNQNSVPDDLDALFEDEDGDINDFFDDAAAESDSDKDSKVKTKKDKEMEIDIDQPTQGSDFDIPSTNNLFTAADDDLAPPLIPPTGKPQEDDASSSVSQLLDDPQPESVEPKQVYTGPSPTPMQPAFQPTATPNYLSHRFMVWNSVGTIRSYTDDTDSAIDVEFHDKQHHYALHFNNEASGGGVYNTIADLSMNAVAMAAESTEDAPSKLTCVYYSSWEGNKEWSVEMPDDEDIKAVTIGESWVALCTDSRLVRMFSLAGMQRFIFSIPGPVVSMAAHTDQLFIVYHSSQGFNGNQCLGYMLLEVGVGTGVNRAKKIVGGDPLPISKKSLLQWIGFSAEGTPATVDSKGVFRLMNRGFCNTWIPVSYLSKLTKNRHDHYWVIGLHENPQEIRAIMCKGSTYPSTLPRPFPSVLQYKLPLCEPDTEKSKFEEEYWRSRLFSSHTDYLESHGFETDEKHKQATKVLLQQTLMKMFALSCKLDRESRAHEICDLMPSSSAVNLAIKYASRLKRMVLAQKLGEVAQEKTQEEMQALMKLQRRQTYDEGDEEESDDPDAFRQELRSCYSDTPTEWAEHKKMSLKKKTENRDTDIEVMEDEGGQEQGGAVDDLPDLGKPSRSNAPSQPSFPLSAGSRNPFKKKSTPAMPSSQASVSGDSSQSTTGVLDSIKRKSSAQKLRGIIAKSHHNALKKPQPKDSKKQQTLSFGSKSKYQLTSTPKGKKPPTVNDDTGEGGDVDKQVLRDVRNECTTGVQLYVSEMRQKLSENNPGLDGLDIRKLAIQDFRKLTPGERQVWNDRAKSTVEGTFSTGGGAKRKLDDDQSQEANENVLQSESDDLDQPSTKSRKTDVTEAVVHPNNTSSRLAAFAYDGTE